MKNRPDAPTPGRPIDYSSEDTTVRSKNIVSSSEAACKRNKSSLAVIFVPKMSVIAPAQHTKGDDFMPTAKKLPSGSWRCQVYSHTEEVLQEDGTIKKKRIYKSFTCDDPTAKGRRKAEQMAADWAADKERLPKSSMTVKEAVRRYIEAKKGVLSPSTVLGYESLEKTCIPLIGDISLDSLTQDRVQTWIGKISVTRSAKTVKNAHALLTSSISMFYPDLHLHTKLPQKEQPDLYIPTDQDIQKLLEYVKEKELEIAIYLAAFGPMRRGEICALKSTDIDGNTVIVNKSMVLTPDKTWKIKQPKTYASYRKIVYPDFVIERIQGIEGRVVKCTPNQLTRRFQRAIQFSGLPHFRFHDLRHYSASFMHAIGIPDSYIMERGGWQTDNVMKTVYRHTLNDRVKEMNRKVNAEFNTLCNTKCNTK